MAAKNVVALASVMIMLAALRFGGPAKAVTAWLMRSLGVSAGAGVLAGQAALAVTVHYGLFPFVVFGAAKLGPAIKRVSIKRAL